MGRGQPRAGVGARSVLKGGERIEEGGRQLEVAYTPGHASHHVSYFSADTGIAFVGDTAGIKIVENGYVLPPTPPPDIDLEAWDESLRTHRAVAPGHAVPDALRPARRRSARTSPNCATTWRSPPTSSRRRLRATGSDEDRESLVRRRSCAASCAGGWATPKAARTRSPAGSI